MSLNSNVILFCKRSCTVSLTNLKIYDLQIKMPIMVLHCLPRAHTSIINFLILCVCVCVCVPCRVSLTTSFTWTHHKFASCTASSLRCRSVVRSQLVVVYRMRSMVLSRNSYHMWSQSVYRLWWESLVVMAKVWKLNALCQTGVFSKLII